jgi:O-succinylbenzoic acid--CoA ligase
VKTAEAIESDWLALRAALAPTSPALIDADSGRAVSWRALDAAASQAASDWNLTPGSLLAIHEDNPFCVAVALFATLRSAAVAVVLNRRLKDDERRQQHEQIGSPIVAGIPLEASEPALSIVLPDFDIREIIESKPAVGLFDRALRERLLSSRRDVGDTPALGLFTSGTTGRSRCAVLPRRALLASAVATSALLDELPLDRWLACMPLFHIGGLSILLRAVVSGAPVVLLGTFDAAAVARANERFKPTLASFVPTMLSRLLDDGAAPGALRACLIGGAAAPRNLLVRAVAAGWPVLATYGLTEAASQVATARTFAPADDGVVGPPVPGATITIARPDADGVGEVVVDAATLMLGYLDPHTARLEIMHAPLHTGDLGRLNVDGALQLFARRSDLIITGGENVYPAEVELALAGCGAVAEAAVVGLPDNEWGQIVAAAIVLAPGATLADVGAFASAALAPHRRPRRLVAVTSLPRNSLGKLDRNAVRALFVAQATSPT